MPIQRVQLPVHIADTNLVHVDKRQSANASSRETLGDPRAFARFLTGVTSPRLSRRKLGSHALFGCFGGVPFAEVLARAQASASAPMPS